MTTRKKACRPNLVSQGGNPAARPTRSGRAAGTPTILTPAWAAQLLAPSRTQPALLPKAHKYANQIRAGTFGTSTITITDTGELIDGIHRCGAVILTGQSIPVSIATCHPRIQDGTITYT